MSAAGVSAGTDALRHCDRNHLSRTAVEPTSNHSCDYRIVCGRRRPILAGWAVSVHYYASAPQGGGIKLCFCLTS